MFDRMTVQSEVDYRRERLARSRPVKRRRAFNRTRIPFVASRERLDGRAR